MNKLFWGLVMVFSIMITAWSGFFLYNELQSSEQATAVPLTPVPQVEAPAPVAVSTETATVEPAVTVESPTANSSEEKSVKSKQSNPNEKQTVVFKYTSNAAKKVFLVGEFNKWFRQPLKREGDVWKTNLKLAPGTYEYVFVVDDGRGGAGKRVIDPTNSKKSKDGKLSLLTVKTDGQ